MALNARLDLRQGQSLVITPQLQQAIKLLQLSNIELDDYVEAEIEKNPLLMRDERDGPAEAEAPAEEAWSREETSEVTLDRLAETNADSQMDARHDDLYADASPGDRATGDAGEAAQEAFQEGFQAGGAVDWSRATGSGGSFDTDGEGMEDRLVDHKSLADHLHDQLAVAVSISLYQSGYR